MLVASPPEGAIRREEPAVSASEQSVLDPSILDDVSGGDTELIQELVELYVSDAEQQFSALVQAAQTPDLEEIGRIAHALKGASASVGCQEASSCFKRLEEMGRTGSADHLLPTVDEAREALARARTALQKLAA